LARSLSHKNVLRRIADEVSLEWALVLENDVVLAVSKAEAQQIFDEGMRMLTDEYPNWAIVHLGGFTDSGASKELDMRPISDRITVGKMLKPSHAFLIRQRVVPDILKMLDTGQSADAALDSEETCFVFHPQPLMWPLPSLSCVQEMLIAASPITHCPMQEHFQDVTDPTLRKALDETVQGAAVCVEMYRASLQAMVKAADPCFLPRVLCAASALAEKMIRQSSSQRGEQLFP